MSQKNSPLAWGQKENKKPLIHYAGNEKTVNPHLMAAEKMTLAAAFVYGEFPKCEFVFQKNRHLYENLDSYCRNYPVDSWSCDSVIGYLKATGSIGMCGGEEYVRDVLRGIGNEQ